ncbi:transcription factor HRS1-like [Olea europaea var. sylvestris]|uniref:Myb family transcription factor EFM isoform X1 n=1 Tax=Olea europaea subsp. europaea TaxID=158383 RepID=A0A8S0RDC0_OLEEU|nr:transcription factor HRS1-like [Olea europaea var. sylvestris]CAA2976888.1 myb family transcription factor EFM isoform X1 [Olea europaea subsp. europaea]
MGSSPPELGLNCRLSSATKTYIPKTIGDFLAEVSMISNTSERLLKLDDYVNRLQDEMKKIDAFKRVLPLCMLLLKDAIVTMEEELKQCKKSNTRPVLEEFIPLKNPNDDEHEKVKATTENDANNRDKMNWMSSVQLWNSDHHHQYPNLDLHNNNQTLKLDIKKGVEEEILRPVMDDLFRSGKNRTMGKESVPFKGCKSYSERKEDRSELSGVTGLSLCTQKMKSSREDIDYSGLSLKSSSSRLGSSLVTNVGSNMRTAQQSKQQQTERKQRRCWSPELHRRFVDALQQLGGPQVATPKQIRELMQVDSLTNDEVKSHLQKYRLHTRRVQCTPTNQPVVLGSLWLSQEQGGESSKPSTSQSGSPQGPLHLTGSSRATSMTAADSMEDNDDENLESHSWKNRIHLSNA